MDKEIVYKGWLDIFSNSSETKSWVKRQVAKPWKRKFVILFSLAGYAENPRLGSYDKEGSLSSLGEPKRHILLYPIYKINKRYDFKGKKLVLEINNDKEQWYFSSDKHSDVDLWATQIQMQSKLSRLLPTCVYPVVGAATADMQRIGASQQKCLLHLNKWGITLALQACRSILAMWPLKTIRNYECGDHCQFQIEAGRRAPMGEGHFVFHTSVRQDEEIFKTFDGFIANALHKKASEPHNNDYKDAELYQTYDQLQRSCIGINNISQERHKHNFLRLTPKIPVPTNNSDYNYITEQQLDNADVPLSTNSSQSPDYNYITEQQLDNTDVTPRAPLSINSSQSPDYNYIEHELDNPGVTSECNEDTPANNKYDTLEHNLFLRSPSNYDNVDDNNIFGSPIANTYDQLSKTNTSNTERISEEPEDVLCYKVPQSQQEVDLKEIAGQCEYRSSTSETDRYDNALFQTDGVIDNSSAKRYDNALFKKDVTDGSITNKGTSNGARSTLTIKHSMQEIADHFIYQIPSSLPSTNEIEKVGDDAAEAEELYVNSDVSNINPEEIKET